MTSAPSVADPRAAGGESRAARLARGVRALRTRASAGLDERLLLVVGAALMPLGLLTIFLGWLGVSHTPLPFEQNSYLISGGVFGLGLLLCGGFVYLTYWQHLQMRAASTERRELTEALARIEAALAGAVGGRDGTPRRQPPEFVATPTGSIFHRRDCQVVVGRDDLTPVDARQSRLAPCRICHPLDVGVPQQHGAPE